MTSGETIVVVQIDASMKAPKALEEVFSYWGHGIAHFLIKRTDLDARKFGAAGAELAYT